MCRFVLSLLFLLCLSAASQAAPPSSAGRQVGQAARPAISNNSGRNGTSAPSYDNEVSVPTSHGSNERDYTGPMLIVLLAAALVIGFTPTQRPRLR